MTEKLVCPVPAAIDLFRGVLVVDLLILLAWLFIEFIFWAANWDETEEKK